MDLTAFKYIRNQKPNFGNSNDGNLPFLSTQGYMPPEPPQWGQLKDMRDEINNGWDWKNAYNNNSSSQTPVQQTPQGPQEKGPKGPSAFKTNLKNANYGAMVQQGIAFAGNLINAYKQPVANQSQLLSNAGTSQGMINGIGYDIQNGIDEDTELANLKAQTSGNTMKTIGSGAGAGAAIGMIGGPIGSGIGAAVGSLIGGIFGGAAAARKKRILKHRMAVAQQKANAITTFNKAGAQTTGLQQDYLQDYGNTKGGILVANRGKDSKCYNNGKSEGNYKQVYSPYGVINGPHESNVGKGESIIDFNNGSATIVDKGTVGVDNQPSSVREDDSNVILGNDIDWRTGDTFARQAAPYTIQIQSINEAQNKVGRYGKLSSLSKATSDLYNKNIQQSKQESFNKLKDLAQQQAKQHNIEGQMNNYRRQYGIGKDWQNELQIGLPSLLGVTEALSRLSNINKQSIPKYDTYSQNQYANRALNGLAGLRYNIYPQLKEYRDSLRQNKYNIDQTGGLTAGQKYIARNDLYNSYINNVAKLYGIADEQNNKYKQQYYDAMMRAGEADRENRINAMRYDQDAFEKAHAAKLAMANQARKDFMENIYRWDKKRVDDKRWRDTVKLYQDDLDIKREDLMGKAGRKNRINRLFGNTPVSMQNEKYLTDLAKQFIHVPQNITFINPYKPFQPNFMDLAKSLVNIPQPIPFINPYKQ